MTSTSSRVGLPITTTRFVNAEGRVDFEALTKKARRQEVSALLEDMAPLSSVAVTGSEDVDGSSKARTRTEPTLRERLETLHAEDPARFAFFLRKLEEELFVRGKLKPKGASDEVYAKLQEVGQRLVTLRATPQRYRAPATGLARKLVALRHDLKAWAMEARLKPADQAPIEQQVAAIQDALVREQQAILSTTKSKKLLNRFNTQGFLAAGELPNQSKQVDRLVRAGLVDKFDLGKWEREHGQGTSAKGVLYVFPRAESLDLAKLDEYFTSGLVDSVGRELEKELKAKFAGQREPITTEFSRAASHTCDDECQHPSLRDLVRVQRVASTTGVPSGMVCHLLRSFENHGLVEQKDGRFSLSAQGAAAGLGYRALRAVHQARVIEHQVEKDAPSDLDLSMYIDAVRAMRSATQTPEYTLTTQHGGLPEMLVLDELFLGGGDLNPDVLEAAIAKAKEMPDDALVVLMNPLRGHHSVYSVENRRAPRRELTSGADVTAVRTQMSLLRQLVDRLGKKRVVIVPGKREFDTAGVRADVQRRRDRHVEQGLAKPSERDAKSTAAKLNDITLNANRKYDRDYPAEKVFFAQVVQPLEYKLGRELHDDAKIAQLCKLDMNEVEILRDVIVRIKEGTAATAMVAYPGLVDEAYLRAVREVLDPTTETIGGTKAIWRDGFRLNLLDEKGRRGYSVVVKPEVRLGISEAMDPQGAVIRENRALYAQGKSPPDVTIYGSTGGHWANWNDAGVMVAAPSLQQDTKAASYAYSGGVPDFIKRRSQSRGIPAHAAVMRITGGVHNGVVTDAMTVEFFNEKIGATLDANLATGRKPHAMFAGIVSDVQVGSPTHDVATYLRARLFFMLMKAEVTAVNGDYIQGLNFGGAEQENAFTGLIGIDQMTEYLRPVEQLLLDCTMHQWDIAPKAEKSETLFIPGNHEWDGSARRKIGASHLTSVTNLYRGAAQGFTRSSAEADKVAKLYSAFEALEGNPVNFPAVNLDRVFEKTGFLWGVQHLAGKGAKGGSHSPSSRGLANYLHAMGPRWNEYHGITQGHFHNPSLTMLNNIISEVTASCCDGSGFEHMLGYTVAQPGASLWKFSTHAPPKLFLATRTYLEQQDEKFAEAFPSVRKIIAEHGSLDAFVDDCLAKALGYKSLTQELHEGIKALRQKSTRIGRKVGESA